MTKTCAWSSKSSSFCAFLHFYRSIFFHFSPAGKVLPKSKRHLYITVCGVQRLNTEQHRISANDLNIWEEKCLIILFFFFWFASMRTYSRVNPTIYRLVVDDMLRHSRAKGEIWQEEEKNTIGIFKIHWEFACHDTLTAVCVFSLCRVHLSVAMYDGVCCWDSERPIAPFAHTTRTPF